jgi:hypothetical protein
MRNVKKSQKATISNPNAYSAGCIFDSVSSQEDRQFSSEYIPTETRMFFWFVTPCQLIGRYQCFGETCCLYLQV